MRSYKNVESAFSVSFFPVHTTSMKNYNHILSTDNKGYAALKFEELKNPGVFPGQVWYPPVPITFLRFGVHVHFFKGWQSFVSGHWQGSVVGAFAQSSEGDATPNIEDAKCEGTDELCYYNTSTCPENLNDVSAANETTRCYDWHSRYIYKSV